MSQHCFFQFANVHRVAARFDYILCAPHKPDQSEAIARGQVTGTQPAVAGKKALNIALVLPIVRSQTATANLAFARYTRWYGLALLIDQADAKRRHGETQVAAPAQQRQLNAHHGKATQLPHAIAVQQNGWDAPTKGQ